MPAWAKDAVYYYIFPERFRNGDRRNDPRPGVDKFHDKNIYFIALCDGRDVIPLAPTQDHKAVSKTPYQQAA